MPTQTDPTADGSLCVTDRRRKRRRRASAVDAVDQPRPRPRSTSARSFVPAAQSMPDTDEDAADDRRQTERRRQIDPTTCERDYKPDEIEFMTAMDDYKRRSGRPFPTWSEVLEVLRDLGYRKVAAPMQTYSGETE